MEFSGMGRALRKALGVRLVARAAADRSGATALEFAIVATPFFFLLFAVLEVTYLFFLSATLENATMDAARRIRTGEMQMIGADADDFRDAVCEGIEVLTPCAERLYVDVRVYENFSAIGQPLPIVDGEFDESGLDADFGAAGDIVVVRVFYLWDVLLPDLGAGLANLDGGRRLIMSSAAFRNEPFGDLAP